MVIAAPATLRAGRAVRRRHNGPLWPRYELKKKKGEKRIRVGLRTPEDRRCRCAMATAGEAGKAEASAGAAAAAAAAAAALPAEASAGRGLRVPASPV